MSHIVFVRSAKLLGVGGVAVQSDRCKEVSGTLVGLLSWTSSVAGELSSLQPVGGDLPTVRHQLDALQVRSTRLILYLGYIKCIRCKLL